MADTNEKTAIGDAELFWLAFEYVAGELSHDSAMAFEARLEHDQSAREAVAAAVDLVASVSSVECKLPAGPGQLTPASKDWSQSSVWTVPAGWLAVGAAACIGLMLATYWPADRPGAAVARRESASKTDDTRLADAWAETVWSSDGRGEDADGSLAFPSDDLMLPEDVDDLLSDEQLESIARVGPEWESADGELVISDWLLEAISAEQAAVAKSGHREG